jgi:hypothetical protein
MKKHILTIAISIVLASMANAQLKINTSGNAGIGIEPTTYDKLLVNGSTRNVGITTWDGWTDVVLDWSIPGGFPVLYGDNNNLYIGKPTNVVNHIWAGSIDATTITYTNACYKVSDKRLKKNIKGLSDILSKIEKINSYSYNYNETFSNVFPNQAQKLVNPNQIGFIAQELQTVFPELVATDTSGYLKVDYISMIPVLLEAIKEQSKSNDSLKSQIKSMNNQLSDIQNCCNTKNGKLKSNIEESDSQPPSIATNNISNQPAQTATAKLYQNAPNPFKESTTIKLEIPETIGSAMVCIYDLTGRQLKCLGVSGRGTTSVQIFGNELTAGLYHYALIADGALIDTKTMVLTN